MTEMSENIVEMTEEMKALMIWRIMTRMRALIELLILNRKDIFGAFLTGLGQEAVPAGVMMALLEKNIFMESPKSGDHRTQWGIAAAADEIENLDHCHLTNIMRSHLCKTTSFSRGRDGNIHWGCPQCRILPFLCADMGRLLPVLVGMAEGLARQDSWCSLPQEKRPVGVCFFGEGADQQGVIAETHSWVAASNCRYPKNKLPGNLDPLRKKLGVLRGVPAFEVVVPNQFSIFTTPAEQHGNSDLGMKVLGYSGMLGITVDGDDVKQVYEASKTAVMRAQQFLFTRIVANTYRRTGHNEDQIQRDPFMIMEAQKAFESGKWDYEPQWCLGTIPGVDPEEFRSQWKKEPLKRYSEYLISSNIATREELAEIMQRARKEIWETYRKVKEEPDITIEENRRDKSLFPPFPQISEPSSNDYRGIKHHLTYQNAFLKTLEELMREDKRITYFGQDVRTGGVLIPTRKVAENFPHKDFFNTPITEEAAFSNAVGRALVGGRPIFEGQQFAPFFGDAFPAMLTVVANNWYQKGLAFPLVDIFHCGVVRSGGSGENHESWPERFLQPMQGIVILAPADAYDLAGLLRSAHYYDGPVAMLLQISAATNPKFSRDVPEEPYMIPLGKAAIKRSGTDFTVITYGAACVESALAEAEALGEEGISVEVIDLRTVWPFDLETLRASIKKTGRFAIFHEDRKTGGVGQTLKATLLEGEESVLPFLRTSSIEVVAADDVPIPVALVLVWDRLPYTREHRSPKLASVISASLREGS